MLAKTLRAAGSLCVALALAALLWPAPSQAQSTWGSGFRRHRGEFAAARAAQRRPGRQGRQQFASGASESAISLPPGVRLFGNVQYGSDQLQAMDVYVPASSAGGLHPVIFMVHGGGWYRGDKSAHGVVQNKLDYYAPKGYILISANYRLIGKGAGSVMDEASDIVQAIAFAQRNAAQWHADPRRFVLMGHSAGANLVTLVNTIPQAATVPSPWLGTVALDSAAYDVVSIMSTPHPDLYDNAFGSDRQMWVAASPTLRLRSATAPMLLVCDSQRRNSCDQAAGFAARDRAFGGRATPFPVAMRHGEINTDVGLPGQLTEAVDGFLHSLGLP